MRFANVDGSRRKAEPGLLGACPDCRAPMIARCGERRVWHWAHKGGRDCDSFHESEGPWHRAWKDLFPEDWQEQRFESDNGEVHRADVVTAHGHVLEFQSSRLEPAERRSREAFYGRKLVWIVDGLRRKRDRAQLLRALDDGWHVEEAVWRQMAPTETAALLDEWCESTVPAFLDFGDEKLYWVQALRPGGPIYIRTFSRRALVGVLRSRATDGPDLFAALIAAFQLQAAKHETNRMRAIARTYPMAPRRLPRRPGRRL